MNATHALSLAACGLIAWGLLVRGDRRRHRALMGSAFAVDLGLVLWIEFTRGAVATSLALEDRPVPGPLLAFHIAVSTVTLVLYGIQLASGTRLFAGRELSRTMHRRCGWMFVAFRLTNLATSFWIAAGNA